MTPFSILDCRWFDLAQHRFSTRGVKCVNNTFRIPSLGSRSYKLKSKIENLKWVRIVAIGFTFAMCGAVAQAQQPQKIPRIGYLAASGIEVGSRAALQQGLRKFGYIEGQNI